MIDVLRVVLTIPLHLAWALVHTTSFCLAWVVAKAMGPGVMDAPPSWEDWWDIKGIK